MSEPPPEGPQRIPPGYVLLNERLVSRDEMAVTPTGSPDRRRWWYVAAGIGALLVVLAIGRALTSPGDRVPEQQQQFMEAVRVGQERVRDGNEVTVVDARLQRQQNICSVLRGRPVEGWVGTLADIDTTLAGESGMITVDLGQGVELRTSNALLGDDDERSVIRPGTPAFGEIADLHDGDEVTFSGSFVPSDDACFHETSLRARNGMLTPGFVFRFTAVASR
jgi:hypothetical protein